MNLTPDEKKMLQAFKDSQPVPRGEFGASFQKMASLIKNAIADLNATINARLAELKDGEDGESADHDAVVRDVLAGIRQPEDGETPVVDYNEIAARAAALIPPPENGKDADVAAIMHKLEQNLPSLGLAIIDAIALLSDDEKAKLAQFIKLDERFDAYNKTLLSSLGPGGGTSFSILQSGVQKVRQPNSLNFKGAGAPTITHTQAGITELNFPGSSGGATVYNETPTGLIDGVNKAYATAHAITTVVGLWVNGAFIHPTDYIATGTTITFGTALDASLSGTPITISYV
jgi:hypothetical protein